MKVDLDALDAMSREMSRWESLPYSDQDCARCHDGMHTPSELEPTTLCNLCAQSVAADVPALIARIRELESALSEAAGTIVSWVITETQCACPADDPDWYTAQRHRALLEKGTTT